jgi:Glu-tRNA(Gln) amidotransferase subunit E-like FAD-binding protein
MYPDTDLPPKTITPERLAAIRAGLPANILRREARYRAIGVPQDLVLQLSASPYAGVFETAVEAYGIDPKLASLVLLHYPKRLRRKGLVVGPSAVGLFDGVLAAVGKKRLYKEGIPAVLERAFAADMEIESILPAAGSVDDVVRDAHRIAGMLKGPRYRDPRRRQRRAMGLLMAEWRGRVDGSAAARCTAQALEEESA